MLTAFSFLLALGVALLTGWLIVRFDHLHAWASHDATNAGPQKFHAHPTPRIGGLAVATAMLACTGFLNAIGSELFTQVGWFLLACSPAFLAGFIEDVTKRIGPDMRLWASFLSGLLALLFFDVVVNNISIPLVNDLLHWYPIAVVFSVFAVGGVAHAVNIIDGYNGLAGMVSMLILGAIGWVGWSVGDQAIFIISAILAGATMGLFFWNWPRAKMFAGDGGAYLWGVSLGILVVLLVGRNNMVSPWFALLVLCYPVTETVFTVYRRKFLHKTASGLPDARHLHQLIYRRVLRAESLPKGDIRRDRLNSATSPFLWCLSLVSIVPAALFWNKTEWLMMFTILFVLTYLWLYRSIVRFQRPRLLQWLGKKWR